MMMMNERMLQFARILLRFALGVTFLLSVAVRFGFVCLTECRAWRRRAFEFTQCSRHSAEPSFQVHAAPASRGLSAAYPMIRKENLRHDP